MTSAVNPPIAGADGCKGGWVFICQIDGTRDAFVASSVRDALERLPSDTQTDGRKISAQAWAILPKIREVDELLQSSPGFRQRIYEMHPEVSFCRWQGEPMKHPKKKVLGYIEREILIDGAWPGDRVRLFEKVRKQASRDDLNDAFAGLWTAGRICDGTAVQLRSPEDDQSGLPMRIVS
jgi:predicted RNase H-like nuclease